jgi:hypothetical protein
MSSLAPTFAFSVSEVPEQTFAFVVRRVAPDQIGEFVTGALERVARFAALREGVAGPPMSVSSAPDDEGNLALKVGFPVPPGTRPEPPIEVRTLPAARAFVHRHAGPYEDLDGDFYGDMYSRMQELGYAPAGAPREVYLGGPYVCVPVTEVVWPIASSLRTTPGSSSRRTKNRPQRPIRGVSFAEGRRDPRTLWTEAAHTG